MSILYNTTIALNACVDDIKIVNTNLFIIQIVNLCCTFTTVCIGIVIMYNLAVNDRNKITPISNV